MKDNPRFTLIIVVLILTASVSTGFSGNTGDSAAGKLIYERNCAICHGKGGKGDGPATAALNPKPKDLTSPDVVSKSDRELFTIITDGKIGTAMIHFDRTLVEQERWDVISYIRTLGTRMK